MKQISILSLLALAGVATAQVPMSLYDLNNRLTPIFALDPTHVGNLEGRLADGPGSGSTAAAINFTSTNVSMLKKQVAQISGGQFLRALHGMPANGGGAYTNQYTMVMDVKMAAPAAGEYFSFFNTTADVNNDGDSFVQWFDIGGGELEGRIGISGQYFGAFKANTWHRVTIVVDCTSNPGSIRYYQDGAFIHAVNIGSALDGRFSAYTWGDPDAEDHIDVFGDNDGDWFNGEASAIAFYDQILSDTQVAGLGTLAGVATIVEGLPFGGSVADLYTSDDNSLFILSDENAPNAELIVSQVTPYATAAGITVETETSATRDDLSLFTSVFNNATNGYDLLGSQTTTLGDVTRTFNITTGMDNYLSDTNGEIKIKMRWIPQQDLEAADGWSEVIDMVNFTISVP